VEYDGIMHETRGAINSLERLAADRVMLFINQKCVLRGSLLDKSTSLSALRFARFVFIKRDPSSFAKRGSVYGRKLAELTILMALSDNSAANSRVSFLRGVGFSSCRAASSSPRHEN